MRTVLLAALALAAAPGRADPLALAYGPPAPVTTAAVPARNAGGIDLVDLLHNGREHDATFRAAIAERRLNMVTAAQTIAGYLPAASYSYANIPTESGARQVVTVTQPIVSLAGLATLRQRGPRRAYAQANFDVRQQELATRLLTAVIDLIKANESTVLNDAKIKALLTQATRAERLYRGGMGTITDAREIAVRYQQALANRILLTSDQAAAKARLGSIAGQMPPAADFHLPPQSGLLALRNIADYQDQQRHENPAILVARQTERINQLETQRIRAGFFPVLGASATMSRRNGVNDSFVGLSITAPLNAGTFFQNSAAQATAERSLEERRQVEEKGCVELERLYALVAGGAQALAIDIEAIQAAELSVEANSRSYDGGVRTSVDVVNAIQTLYEFKNNYVVAATGVAGNLLNLLLVAGVPPEEAMATVQTFMLGA